jgi:hypothetical protein
VVAVLVLAVGYEGLIPGVHLPGGKATASGPTGAIDYDAARSVAMSTASSVPGGPWSVLLGGGFSAVRPEVVPAFNSSSLSLVGCTATAGPGAGAIDMAASPGSVGQGVAPLWVFELTGASGSVVVTVNDGQGALYATVSGTGCGLAGLLNGTVSSSVVDSTTAVDAANSAGGSAFLQTHPEANESMAVIAGFTSGIYTLPPTWVVEYSDCSLLAPSDTTTQLFEAAIDATSGAVEMANTTTTSCPTASGGLPTIGLSSGGGSAPLASVLTVGASSAGACNGTGSAEICSYIFPTVAAGGVSVTGLSATLQNASGASESPLVRNVTLSDGSGCVVGTYEAVPGAGYGWLAGSHACPSGAGLDGLVSVGDTWSLSTTTPVGGHGDVLVFRDNAFSGTVEAAVT